MTKIDIDKNSSRKANKEGGLPKKGGLENL